MKKTILLIALLTSSIANGQWTDLNTPSAFLTTRGIHFTSPTTGYLCGYAFNSSTFLNDGLIYKTTNGGVTWTSSLTLTSSFSGFNPQTFILNDFFFIDANTGFAVGQNFNYGFVCKTTNGGATWDTTTVQNVPGLMEAYFIDANTGFCAANDESIVKTTDGGNTWTTVAGPGGGTFMMQDIQFVSSSVGYACSYMDPNTNQFRIYKTTNGGNNWSVIYTINNSTNDNLFDLHFVDANTGYISCSNGDVYKTTNGGTSFTPLSTGLYKIQALHFVSAQIGYVAGIDDPSSSVTSYILKTTNGGTTWTQDHIINNISDLGNDFSFSGSTAYCLRNSLSLSKTTNAPIGVDETETESSLINVYPVPSDDFIMIQNESNSAITGIELFDCTGRLMMSFKENGMIDISSLSPGLYLVSVTTEKFSVIKNIIKQ